VKAARDAWFEKFADVEVQQLVFLDEFGATTQMTRTHALALRGERAVCKVPHGHWKMISTIAAMGTGGMVAAASFDGATDTETFVIFVRDELLPQLRPGQIVVMDNLPAHKSPQVDRLLERVDCRALRLPPYSPDYNPIEMAISKVKRILRSRAERTVSGLFDAIDVALHDVTAADAEAFARHCGYYATTV
jgi:transposase